MTTTQTQTALMPIDPAMTPAQVFRIPAIRAHLLPEEIKAGRNAKRTRVGLIGAVIIVIVGLAGWYVVALQQLSSANDNLATATDQVQRAQAAKKDYVGVTRVIADRDAVTGDLKSLLANDLPWATTLDTLRKNAKDSEVTIDVIGGTVLQDTSIATTALGSAKGQTVTTVATLSITGTGPDKKHIATFLDKLAALKGVSDPYLTTASNGENGLSYALTAKITSAALCGRFTTACVQTAGGN